jgi:hypothetical protein
MRGQAHTLEATVAALLMLSSVIFALQVTAVTPLSASTSSQHIENQQQSSAQGVLTAAANADALKPAILYWDNGDTEYHNTGSIRFYTSGPPDNRFGGMLQRAFGDNGIAYNVNFIAESRTDPRQYIYSGVPSDNAVSATHTVTLNNDDVLYDDDEQPTDNRLGDSGTGFWIDMGDGGPEYETVQVEVVVWRI